MHDELFERAHGRKGHGLMARRNMRKVDPRPAWSDDEDARLIEMAGAGLCGTQWEAIFPERRFGDVAERRMELVDAGRLKLPRRI